MGKQSANVFVPTSYSVWTAAFGSTPPTSPTATPSAAFYEIGYLSDAGITEGRNINETKIYDMVGSLLATARNQEERPFTFAAAEDNRVVRELRYPNSTQTTTGGTSEVQTITETATGGTFAVAGGYGGAGATSQLAYNVAPAALQTALRTLPGLGAVTVTGTAGTSYVITFPASIGNVNQLSLDVSGLTGGTATIATTTPGVAPVNTRNVGAGTGQNLRVFLIYVTKGNVHKLFVINNGEATQSGELGYTGSGAVISEFSLQPYPDQNNNFFVLMDDDPAQNVAYA